MDEHAEFLSIMRYHFPSREAPRDEAFARVEQLVRENPLSAPLRAAAVSYFESIGELEARDRLLARSLALFPGNDVFLNLAVTYWGSEMSSEERDLLSGKATFSSESHFAGVGPAVLDWARGAWHWVSSAF